MADKYNCTFELLNYLINTLGEYYSRDDLEFAAQILPKIWDKDDIWHCFVSKDQKSYDYDTRFLKVKSLIEKYDEEFKFLEFHE